MWQNAISYSFEKFKLNWQPLLVALLLNFVPVIGGFATILFLTLVTLRIIKEDKVITIDEMFKVIPETDNLIQWIIGMLVVGLLVGIGTILCILPGIVIGVLLTFVGMIILDKKISFSDAISISIELGKANFVQILLFEIVIGVITMITCGFGAIITIPMSVLATGYFYKELVLNNESNGSNSTINLNK